MYEHTGLIIKVSFNFDGHLHTRVCPTTIVHDCNNHQAINDDGIAEKLERNGCKHKPRTTKCDDGDSATG